MSQLVRPVGSRRRGPRSARRRAPPIRLAPVPPDTYLTGILATHRARAAADARRLDDLVDRARPARPTRARSPGAWLGPGRRGRWP